MKKYNLLVPLAGKGQRMIDGGYNIPKPLLLVGDRHIIDYGLASIDTSECNLIFVVRRDHICNYAIDKVLKKKFGIDIQIIVAEKDTGGSVDSCRLAEHLIDNEVPLIIFTPDVCWYPKFVPTPKIFEDDGFILTFKANSANYSYVESVDGLVTRTAEKIVISEDASVGIYCFKSGHDFIQLSEPSEVPSKTENYIAPLYNKLIGNGGKVRTAQVPTMYIMGTPAEMDFFKKVVFPYFLPRSFVLCGDHSGFDLKEQARSLLKARNVLHVDCGSYTPDNCDYSDYISQAVETKTYYPGSLILGFCRSGQGVNICANKYPGIRGALVTTAASASLAIRHNAANFFAIPAGTVSPEALDQIIEVLLIEQFEGGRHQNRLQKLNSKEA